MNKFLLLIAVFFFIVSSVFAQMKPVTQLSIGGEFGLPAGQADQIYGSVLGGSVKLELPVSYKPLYFTITAGISNYFVKFNYTGLFVNSIYVPIEIGGKYYFSKIGYFEGDLGVSNNINSNYTAAKTAFIYSPVFGFSAPTNKHTATVDIGLRYEGRVESGGTVSQFALRVAYRFKLK